MGSQGGPALRRGRAAPPVSSSPWLLQREGKHPLSCTSYSLPPAGRPLAHTLMETNKDWPARPQGVMHVSVSAHHAPSVESHCAFAKVFLRMAPCRMTDRSLHRHQTGTPASSSLSTPTERDNVGGDWTLLNKSGYLWNCQVCLGRTCVLHLALSFSTFSHLQSLSVVLGDQAQHTLGFRLHQLVWEAGDPASQSKELRRRNVN